MGLGLEVGTGATIRVSSRVSVRVRVTARVKVKVSKLGLAVGGTVSRLVGEERCRCGSCIEDDRKACPRRDLGQRQG